MVDLSFEEAIDWVSEAEGDPVFFKESGEVFF
jgi:hypothetical protein